MEFKVPGDFVIQQSPQNLPPVYNGEKMVVYGVLTPKGSPQDREITGKAILKGQILGKKMEHSVPFTFNPATSSHPSLLTIHHLAAKALIKDWQEQGKSKEEIVKLSVDSSVISSHTAFIAVDEENSEPISGAMKTWDVQAQRVYSDGPSALMSSNIDRILTRGCQLDDLNEKSAELNASAVSFSKFAKRKKAGFSFGSLFSGFTGRFSKSESSQPALNRSDSSVDPDPVDELLEESSRDSYYRSDSYADKELDIDDLEEEDESMQVVCHRVVPKPRKSQASSTTNTAPFTLTSLIMAQQADGSWKLDTTLTQLLAKSQKDIEDACPVKCNNDLVVIWATVLILTLLKRKYSSQQDEWELIAMKAESWVKKQVLPSGVTVKDLYTAAGLLV